MPADEGLMRQMDDAAAQAQAELEQRSRGVEAEAIGVDRAGRRFDRPADLPAIRRTD